MSSSTLVHDEDMAPAAQMERALMLDGRKSNRGANSAGGVVQSGSGMGRCDQPEMIVAPTRSKRCGWRSSSGSTNDGRTQPGTMWGRSEHCHCVQPMTLPPTPFFWVVKVEVAKITNGTAC